MSRFLVLYYTRIPEVSTLVKVENLVKSYSDTPVLHGISFEITENGVYGFLGPNGAGKSTTMNIITGCLSATEGRVVIGGYDIVEEPEQAKKLIGYLPEQPPLYMDMTPYEYLCFVAAARGVAGKEIRGQVERSMELTGISPVRDRLIKHLSKGYKQRVGISETLLGDPRVIILDEPTGGLDPKQITEIRDLVRELGRNHIILFSSHIMQEVQAISNHIMIIARGRLLISGKPEELEQYLRRKPVITIRAKASVEDVARILSDIPGIDETELLEESGGYCTYKMTAEDYERAAERIFFAFAAAGLALIGLEHEAISLEEAFLQLTSGMDTYSQEPDGEKKVSKDHD